MCLLESIQILSVRDKETHSAIGETSSVRRRYNRIKRFTAQILVASRPGLGDL